MTNDKPKGKKREIPEGGDDPMVGPVRDMYLSPKRQCTAMSKHTGKQCQRFAMRGLRVCVVHGGATRAAKAKAAERISAASGYAADLLVEFMANPEIDVKSRTQIAQDILDRGGINAKRVMELTVEKGRSFADVTADVVMDLVVDDQDTTDVIDAEVIEFDESETDEERWAREDQQHQRVKEIERMKRGQPSATAPDLNAQRARQEADLIRRHERGELGEDDLLPERAQREAKLTREQLLMERIARSTSSERRRTMSPKRYEQRKRE